MTNNHPKGLTVAELIKHLQQYDPTLPVAYYCCSEACELYASNINLEQGQYSRRDGWVHDARPDKPSRTYVMFPGN